MAIRTRNLFLTNDPSLFSVWNDLNGARPSSPAAVSSGRPFLTTTVPTDLGLRALNRLTLGHMNMLALPAVPLYDPAVTPTR